jgi:CheY-like chemotaxis protein
MNAVSVKKLLIVDDNKVILETMSMKLTAHGYHVITALDGAEAISTVRNEKPDLILLDIGFPIGSSGVHWDGFLILDWLRRADDTKDIPVIMISRGEPEKNQERALAAGAAALFHKPVDNEKLLETIRGLLGEGAGD